MLIMVIYALKEMYFLITTMIMLIVFHHTQCMLIMVICTKVNVFLEMVMLSILA